MNKTQQRPVGTGHEAPAKPAYVMASNETEKLKHQLKMAGEGADRLERNNNDLAARLRMTRNQLELTQAENLKLHHNKIIQGHSYRQMQVKLARVKRMRKSERAFLDTLRDCPLWEDVEMWWQQYHETKAAKARRLEGLKKRAEKRGQ